MTHRMILIGRRKEGISHEECIEYLEEKHVPLIKELPGLQRCTTSIPTDPDETEYDEMAQLQFETADDLRAAVESEEWDRVLRDAERFLDVDDAVILTVADETVQYQAIPEGV